MWVFEYKELIKNLVIGDLKVKYQSSMLGFAWSMLNPLLMMLVLYIVFKMVFKITQQNFALYILIGIIAWRFFAIGTNASMGAIVGKSSLVTKVYIPREILVLSMTTSSFISSILEFMVLIPLLFLLGATISLNIFLFPLIHILYFFIVYGLGLALGALYVYYRDLNQIWDVLLQIGFFLCPIVYPISLIPASYLDYYTLNPITRVIEMYRTSLLFGNTPSVVDFIIIFGFGLILLLIGQSIFKKLEPRFAEEV